MKQINGNIPSDLYDEDIIYISEIFFNNITEKLKRLGARSGNLCCEFAGEKYKNWSIRFRSAGSEFEIVEFEYDKNSTGIDLDL